MSSDPRSAARCRSNCCRSASSVARSCSSSPRASDTICSASSRSRAASDRTAARGGGASGRGARRLARGQGWVSAGALALCDGPPDVVQERGHDAVLRAQQQGAARVGCLAGAGAQHLFWSSPDYDGAPHHVLHGSNQPLPCGRIEAGRGFPHTARPLWREINLCKNNIWTRTSDCLCGCHERASHGTCRQHTHRRRSVSGPHGRRAIAELHTSRRRGRATRYIQRLLRRNARLDCVLLWGKWACIEAEFFLGARKELALLSAR